MMIDIKDIVSAISKNTLEDTKFYPTEIPLTEYFPESTKEEQEEATEVQISETEKVNFIPLESSYPFEYQVIAIDSTSFVLGYVHDGIVGATRASLIIKPANQTQQHLELYGPFLTVITNQIKDTIYNNLFKIVYGKEADSQAPALYKMLDRIRNLLERYLQFEVVKKYKDSLVLFDGSLIGGTVANPKFFVEKILKYAVNNRNSIVAISKFTNLTLKQSKKSILSLLDGIYHRCCVENIKNMISQNKDRYLGDIYVAKLTPFGEPFRIDIDPNSPIQHSKLLKMLSGLAGDYGYPEELKLAHSTCILSSIEIIELQAAAVALYGLNVKEDLRKKIFPFG